MTTTSGYGETPAAPDPEQPEWLRKATRTPSSASPHAAAPAAPDTPSPAGAYDGYANPTGRTQPPPSPYQGAPQGYGPAQHQDRYQGPYQASYPAPGPGTYLPTGSPQAVGARGPKSRLAAGLLGIFLGPFGIHRFYLGYTAVGVTMLLMTVLTCGFLSVVTSVWGLVEGILYLTDKTGRYSRDASGRRLRG